MAATSASEDASTSSPDSKGVVPLNTWVLISNFKVAYNLLRRPDGSFNRHLDEFLDRKVPDNKNPVDTVASIDVIIERPAGLWGRIFWSTEPLSFACEPDSSPSPPNAAESTTQEDSAPIPIHGEQASVAMGESSSAAAAPSSSSRRNLKPLLLYFHGGSFVHSSANSAIYDAMCRRLARLCGAVVLSVNFRRAPEHRHPAAYEDGLSALRWAKGSVGRHRLRELGCDPDRCFAAGDSSGGNIAHNVAVMAAGAGIPLSGTVLLMPMFGGQNRTHAERLLDGKYFVTMKDRDWYWRAFLPLGASRDHPACNPFSAIAPSLAEVQLPPCLVVVGGLDILKDWQLKFYHCMDRAGKPVKLLFLEQATMGFFLLPNTELFYSLVENLKRFLHEPWKQQQVSASADSDTTN